MKCLWLALFMPAVLLCSSAFAVDKGGESHGGDVFEINGVQNVFDVLEHQKEFVPNELDEYTQLIAPQLAILKRKLPRTGRYLENAFVQGFQPRWYFVKATLKHIQDEGHSNLALAYKESQIAANSGLVVQIQQDLYNQLADLKNKAYLLVHESMISSIGVTYVRDGSEVRSLAALFLHRDLGKAPGKVIAEQIQSIVAEPKSKLYQLAGADIGNVVTTNGFVDQSTEKDGVTASSCLDDDDQCVFEDNATHVYWTKLFVESIGAKSWNDASKYCSELKGFGGFDDWRLPSLTELKDLSRNQPQKVYEEFPNWGTLVHPIWSKTPFVDDLSRVWAVDLRNANQTNYAKNTTRLGFRCVRSDLDRKWVNLSVTDDGKYYTECTRPTDRCAFKEASTGLVWTRVNPGETGKTTPLLTFEDAQGACSSLPARGEAWRFPTVPEWRSAIANHLFAYTNRFPGSVVGDYNQPLWAMTPEASQLVSQSDRYASWSLRTTINPATGQESADRDEMGGEGQRHRLVHQQHGWICVYQSYPTTGPDEDGDGVPDAYDKCPGTPKGTAVYLEGERAGCTGNEGTKQ